VLYLHRHDAVINTQLSGRKSQDHFSNANEKNVMLVF